ncbi:MAG: uracil-DNA glycosylase family protein [Chloroflexota bacterium]
MIDTLMQLIPEDLMGRSGSVFYSGKDAFTGMRPLYLLGVNPGGDPSKKSKETVRWHTNKVLREESDNWSAYRDESWEGALPGAWGMQPRVLHLLRGLKLDPGEVPASNIVFLRSRREGTIAGSLNELAEACWPFHRRVIEELNIRVVLCFGKTAGGWVCKQLGADRLVGQFIEHNNRRWKSTAFRNSDGITVVVGTHPSIADWTSPATDPTELVRRMLH